MKKAISILLILSTLLSCCVIFFACNKDDDDDEVSADGSLKNTSTVILDFENDSNISKAGLSSSSEVYDLSGATKSAKWQVTSNAGSRILTLEFDKVDLSSAKEISFWMNNDSQYDIAFNVYYIMEDGSEVRASATFYNQSSSTATPFTTKNVIVHPGWHEYKLALSEVEPLEDKSYAYVDGEDEEDEGSIELKFDKSKITGIKLDGSRITFTGSANLYFTSIKSNTVKTGTMNGYYFNELANAVAFYKASNAYLYNQNRYVLSDKEKEVMVGNNDTQWVPVEVLARHRGATITASDKDNKIISFNYKGQSYTFKEGDDITFVGDERGFSAGVTLTVKASSLSGYVTIPMEKAAEIFGYKLYFDQMGLAVFSDVDLKELYLHPLHENYRSDMKAGLPAIYNIIQVIAFKTYTGAEIIDDMNSIHGVEGHSKLMVTQAQFDVLKERLETDQVYAAWFNRFESANAKGTSNYSSALPYFVKSDGHRLLSMSRDVMGTLITYSFLYKMTDNEDYANKVRKTMLATVRFIDKELTGVGSWHPEHTLDTGEICYGMGIAYDWCYDYLAKDKKDLKTIEEGVFELGYGAFMGFGDLYQWWDDASNMQKYNDEMLNDDDPSTGIYQSNNLGQIFNIKDGEKYKKYKFDRYKWTNNWGAVCAGGAGVMALAFANVNTEFRAASEYLLDCCQFNFPCMLYESYAPDGGYPEGPGYWSYGTTYSMQYFAALASATGSEMGLSSTPGFRESFYFINATASPAHGTWNYHDAGVGGIDGSRFFWFAYQCGDTNIAAVRYNQLITGKSNPGYFDLMYYNPDNISNEVALDLDYCYYGIGVVTFRSDWTDSALFCGLHGGANAASHGQLDIGNFILEYGGTRFFYDLGSDEYNLTGYSNGSVTYFSHPYRYWYYRNRAEGQNTLVINPVRVDTNNRSNSDTGQAQKTNFDSNYAAEADVLRYESGKTSALAVVDIGCAYRTLDKYKSAFQSQALDVFYACPSCDYETAGICKGTRCNGKTQMKLGTHNNAPALICPVGNCNTRISAACPDCGATLISKHNGIRGMLVSENRTTVVIQDEIWLDAPASKIMWMGHVAEGSKVTISDDKKSALIQVDGKTLLVQIVVPEGYTGNWYFETQAADYLPETGLVMTPGEYNRDGLQKLVCIGENISEIKLAVVCKLLSSGPHSYKWTDIEDWTTDR